MNDRLFRTIHACRVCGFVQLTPILSLGDLCVSDFLSQTEQRETIRAPLELVLCNESDGGCGLLQLRHTVSHEALYRNYWYRSGMNQTMTDELNSIAAAVESIVGLSAGDFVMDIGANDGTLLRGYHTPGLNRIGFEPARNLAQYNRVGTTKVIGEFFNFPAWREHFSSAHAKAITAIAMFYDLDDPNAFVSDVGRCLDTEGVFIIQMSYLPLMLSQNAFDNICHEHLEYYSLLSVEALLRRHRLEVFDVELNDINGGSFRIYVRHSGGGRCLRTRPGAQERVASLRDRERALGLSERKVYEEFVERVNSIRHRVADFVQGEVARGKKVYVYGASTKGNTLLQYFGLACSLIGAAAERNADKWGTMTVGTMIPIISEEQARSEKPDYFLILPWHFLEEFQKREVEYLTRGGRFIVPLPEFRLLP